MVWVVVKLKRTSPSKWELNLVKIYVIRKLYTNFNVHILYKLFTKRREC